MAQLDAREDPRLIPRAWGGPKPSYFIGEATYHMVPLKHEELAYLVKVMDMAITTELTWNLSFEQVIELNDYLMKRERE